MIKSTLLKGEIERLKVNIFENPLQLNHDEKNWLNDNILPPQYPIKIDQLNVKMSELFGEKNRKREIKYYIKHKANYSYKKGSSMLYAGASKQNILLQSIYSSYMLGKVSRGNYLVNIDEASF